MSETMVGRVDPDAQTGALLLEIEDLVTTYPVRRGIVGALRGRPKRFVHAVDGVSFSLRSGEMIALVGESGAGKSTLLHLLGGLDTPSGGTIHYGSREISGLAPSELSDFRNREIGFVWQIHYLLPEFTAQENVMMPLLIRGWSHAKAASDALTRLDEVGLRARASHRACTRCGSRS